MSPTGGLVFNLDSGATVSQHNIVFTCIKVVFTHVKMVPKTDIECLKSVADAI